MKYQKKITLSWISRERWAQILNILSHTTERNENPALLRADISRNKMSLLTYFSVLQFRWRSLRKRLWISTWPLPQEVKVKLISSSPPPDIKRPVASAAVSCAITRWTSDMIKFPWQEKGPFHLFKSIVLPHESVSDRRSSISASFSRLFFTLTILHNSSETGLENHV